MYAGLFYRASRKDAYVEIFVYFRDSKLSFKDTKMFLEIFINGAHARAARAARTLVLSKYLC